MSEIDVLYICDYGQSEFNICPLMDEKCDKKDSCNLRAVVPYKQLQQLKAENEELKNLHINLVGVKECEIKELQQLKAENDELKKQLIQKDEVNTFFNTLDWNSNPCEICPKKNYLDEIEEIAKNGVKDDCGMPLDELSIILKLIKQAKEGE